MRRAAHRTDKWSGHGAIFATLRAGMAPSPAGRYARMIAEAP